MRGDLGPFLAPDSGRTVVKRGQVWPARSTEKIAPLGAPGAATAARPDQKGVVMRIALHERVPHRSPAREEPATGSVKPAARFGLHVMQMCVVMCISLGLLAALYLGAAAVLGLSTGVWQDVPALSVLVVSAVLAGSMLVWMRFMGMEWRPTLEMAGAAILAGAVVLVAYWFGVIALKDLLTSACGVACVIMIGQMLFRFGLYSGQHTPAG